MLQRLVNSSTGSTFVLGALAGAGLTYTFIKFISDKHPNISAGSVLGGSNAPNDSTTALADLLQNTSIEYLLTPTRKPVVVIEYKSLTDDYRSSIDFALMLMEDNNLVSIPVVDLEKRRYVGMLNVVDIVSFLVTHIREGGDDSKDGAQALAATLRSVPISEVMKYNREPFLPLYATAPLTLLLHVMSTLADEVPVMGSEYQIVNIASRTDLLRFVRENVDALGPRADYPVRTLLQRARRGGGGGPGAGAEGQGGGAGASGSGSGSGSGGGGGVGGEGLETISPDTRVIDALKIMDRNVVSELAIVDKVTGRLTGNLVAADLRRLSVYNLARLYEPVSKFVITHAGVSTDDVAVVWVEPAASLRTVISKFVETRTPVVWVVEVSGGRFHPIDCISLRSVMKLILDFLNTSNTTR